MATVDVVDIEIESMVDQSMMWMINGPLAEKCIELRIDLFDDKNKVST